MKKIYHILTSLILVILVALAAILFLPKLLGMTPLAVLSGSMEPTYHVGSLIYVKDADPKDVQIGDPITFKISDDTMVTHRVVAIDAEAQTFQTKGDANDNVDGGAVAYENLVGKPVFTVPYMGYLAVYANTTTGMIVMVTVILVILILTFLPDFLMKGDNGEEKEAKKDPRSEKTAESKKTETQKRKKKKE